ncbi:Solitary outer membrane autotransporter beta-barrel domain [Psychromonas sp. SP041]|uniref:Solitary outer membrane autotransporter beta-barrel domain n=1 Tax=Psychromonas sp. SP041 TaxID=1365007 RepID=UPI00040CDFB9|nr:Solitary outer membrane autotransporter beta-barrel domain [Psychromonas sp. SP041]
MIKSLTLLLLLAYSPLSLSSTAQRNSTEALATAVVLSDSDSISIGISNFDPQTLFNKNKENQTGRDAIALRNSLSIYNLPYTFVLDKKNEDFSNKIMFRLTYTDYIK